MKSLCKFLLAAAMTLPSLSFADLVTIPVVAHLDPVNGWNSAGQILPQASLSAFFSNGGSASWAFGQTSTGGNYHSIMTVSSGTQWGAYVTYPFSTTNGTPDFIPAYPESTGNTAGWAVSGNSIAYFDGTQFYPTDATTFANLGFLQIFSSNGQAWAIAGSNDANTPDYISTFNNATHTWSKPQVLPIQFILIANQNPSRFGSTTLAATASGGQFYFLGRTAGTNTQIILFKVDATGNLTQMNFPNISDATDIPLAILLADTSSNGQKNMFTILYNRNGGGQVDSYYSKDGGQTWVDSLANLPGSTTNYLLVNNTVVTPPVLSNGVYMDLSQTTPSWQSYPMNPLMNPEPLSNIAANGSQQCQWVMNKPNVLQASCFTFATGQWTNSSPVPNFSTYYNISQNVIALGNGRIASFGEDRNANVVALYYSGTAQGWSSSIVPNFGVSSSNNGLSQSTEGYMNPNNIWLWESVNQN